MACATPIEPNQSTRSAAPSPRCDCGGLVPLNRKMHTRLNLATRSTQTGEAFRFVRLRAQNRTTPTRILETSDPP
jgi:hypothetical protein